MIEVTSPTTPAAVVNLEPTLGRTTSQRRYVRHTAFGETTQGGSGEQHQGSASPRQGSLEPCRIDAPKVVLRAVDKCHWHLVGVATLQLGIAVDINDRVALAGLGTNGRHPALPPRRTDGSLPREYDDPLRALEQLHHVTSHDAGV